MSNEIVEKNLERMISSEKGGMNYLLFNESLGGNAGNYGSYPCAGLRFFYDSDSGLINYFGNIQDVSLDVRKQPEGYFVVAINFKAKERPCSILETGFIGTPDSFARAVLRLSASEFNERYGFKIESSECSQ